MADERPSENPKRDKPEGPGDPSAGGTPGRDEGQSRRGGRHRGFRGRHLGRSQGPDPAAPPVGQPGGQPVDGRDASRPPYRDDQGQRPRGAQPEDARDMPACPLCGKPVYDLSTALSASREAGDPAHFDCVLERVSASESIADGEKLVYLGSGSFAVVEFKDKNESVFAVKRRIQWEKEGEKKDWRKGLSSRISNL